MILDFLTVFFLVAGSLLLIRLIRQQRRAQATIVIEENKLELEPAAAGASSFGRRDAYSNDLDTISKATIDPISQGGLREKTSGTWTDEGKALKPPSQRNFDLSKLISVLEANVENGVVDHFTLDPAKQHSLSIPPQGLSVEAQTPQSVLERSTIVSADDDLAKMLGKIDPDS
jgi:hypothetical protein